jgi:hypothetical protein
LGLFSSADFGGLIGPQNMRWANEPLEGGLPIFYSFSLYFLFPEIYFILRKYIKLSRRLALRLTA